jgi:hypothetical protein
MSELQQVLDVVQEVKAVLDRSGPLGFLGVSNILGIILSKVVSIWAGDNFQKGLAFLLRGKAQFLLWDNQSDLARKIIVFVFSTVAGIFTAMSGAMVWWHALIMVPLASLVAMIKHGSAKWDDQKKTLEAFRSISNTYSNEKQTKV